LRFEAGKAFAQTDWSGAGALALDVKNPNSEPIEIYIRVDDSEAQTAIAIPARDT
jgi:hypothetical protein